MVFVAAALMMVSLANEDAASLPSAVTEAYAEYESALDRQDFAAASQAAETAFGAALVEQVAASDRLTLGLNALSMAPARGTGAGLTELVEETAALTSDPELVREIRLLGFSAAVQSGDIVSAFATMDPLVDALLESPVETADGQAQMYQAFFLFGAARPSGVSSTLSDARRVQLEDERAALLIARTDPVRLANITLELRRHAQASDDRARALQLTAESFSAVSSDTENAFRARRALVEGLADILVADGQSMATALEGMPVSMRDAVCAHLASQPVPMMPWREVQVPLRFVERGIMSASGRFEFEVVDGEAEDVAADHGQRARGRAIPLSDVRRNLSRTRFHARCDGAPASGRGIFRVTYAGQVTGQRGGATHISFGVLQSIAPVEASPVEP